MRLSGQIQEFPGLSCCGKFVSRDEGGTCTLRRGHEDNGRAGMYKPCIRLTD
jgi:hypothetical protein